MTNTLLRTATTAALGGASLGALTLSLALGVAVPTAAAQAQEPAAAPATTTRFDIPAQDAAGALEAFGRQSGKAIMYDRDRLGTRQLRGLQGDYTPDAALRMLTEGSGLTVRMANANTFVVEAPGEPYAGGSGGGNEALAQGQRGIAEILVIGSKSQNVDIRRTEDDIQPYVIFDKEQIQRSGAVNIGDLLQTRLTMNYVARPEDQINSSNGAASSVSLRGLSAEQTLILIDGRRAGNRPAFGLEKQADLNGIPINAIERIEILPATASGIYGGGATGGVVNVILRHDYKGIEASFKHEGSFAGGGSRRSLDIFGGLSLNGGKTSIQATGSIADASPLYIKDRRFYADYVRRIDSNRRQFDPSYFINFPVLGATPNISSVPFFDYFGCYLPGIEAGGDPVELGVSCNTSPNLTFKPEYGGGSLGSPATFIPNGYPGIADGGIAGLVQNAGQYNLALANTAQTTGRKGSLINDPTTLSASVNLRHQFSPDIEAFLNLAGSQVKSHFSGGLILFNTYTVNADAPNNPFDQAIRVTIPINLEGHELNYIKARTFRIVSGLKFGLPRGWNAAIEYAYDRNSSTASEPTRAISPLADSAIATGALDILKAPPPDGFDLSQYILTGNYRPVNRASLHDVSLRFGGTLLRLPAGKLSLTSLLEYKQQLFGAFRSTTFTTGNTPVASFYTPQSSTVKSLYTEAIVPLISEDMKIPLLRSVELQIAGRLDQYKNIGGLDVASPDDFDLPRPTSRFRSFDPTIGLRVQPIESLTFRASYGTGFFPPPLVNLAPSPPIIFPGWFFNLVDPQRGGEPVGDFQFFSGGNPNLKPERSTTWSAGLIFKPLDGLRLSADWTRIKKRDNITTISLGQDVISQAEFLPNIVIRNTDPSTFGPYDVGPIIGFNSGFTNITNALSESVDLAASYFFETRDHGSFELYGRATHLIHNKRQLTPLAAGAEYAGSIGYPTWQANASLTWNWRDLSITWFSRYLDKVWVRQDHLFDASQGSRRLGSQTLHDLSMQYRFPQGIAGSGAPASLQIGVKNVFNTRPRLTPGIYDGSISPLMSSYNMVLTVGF